MTKRKKFDKRLNTSITNYRENKNNFVIDFVFSDNYSTHIILISGAMNKSK